MTLPSLTAPGHALGPSGRRPFRRHVLAAYIVPGAIFTLALVLAVLGYRDLQAERVDDAMVLIGGALGFALTASGLHGLLVVLRLRLRPDTDLTKPSVSVLADLAIVATVVLAMIPTAWLMLWLAYDPLKGIGG